MTRIHFEVGESRACDWRKPCLRLVKAVLAVGESHTCNWRKPCLRLVKAEDDNGKEGISMF